MTSGLFHGCALRTRDAEWVRRLHEVPEAANVQVVPQGGGGEGGILWGVRPFVQSLGCAMPPRRNHTFYAQWPALDQDGLYKYIFYAPWFFCIVRSCFFFFVCVKRGNNEEEEKEEEFVLFFKKKLTFLNFFHVFPCYFAFLSVFFLWGVQQIKQIVVKRSLFITFRTMNIFALLWGFVPGFVNAFLIKMFLHPKGYDM